MTTGGGKAPVEGIASNLNRNSSRRRQGSQNRLLHHLESESNKKWPWEEVRLPGEDIVSLSSSCLLAPIYPTQWHALFSILVLALILDDFEYRFRLHFGTLFVFCLCSPVFLNDCGDGLFLDVTRFLTRK